MTSRTGVSALLLSLSLILVSCGTSRIDRELANIHDEIKKQFGEETKIRLGQGDRHSIFFVTFENSPLNERAVSTRSRLAHNVATVVKKNFTGFTGRDEIWVMFLRVKTNLIILNRVEEVDTFRFDREARLFKTTSVDVPEGNPLLPRATYIENADQSDVAMRIQLNGEPGTGLTLIPHFTVAGNAEEEKAKAPGEVSLDFALFSRQLKFSKDMKVRFDVDRKTIFESGGRVSQYPGDNGTYSEFCYVKIPYTTFKELSSGTVLTIKVANTDYELTPEELSGLRKMADFVKE